MRTSRKTDFRKLKIIFVSMTYPGKCSQCPSLSLHVLFVEPLVAHFLELSCVHNNSRNSRRPAIALTLEAFQLREGGGKLTPHP